MFSLGSPTDPFTTLEFQYVSYNVPELYSFSRPPDCERAGRAGSKKYPTNIQTLLKSIETRGDSIFRGNEKLLFDKVVNRKEKFFCE